MYQEKTMQSDNIVASRMPMKCSVLEGAPAGTYRLRHGRAFCDMNISHCIHFISFL